MLLLWGGLKSPMTINVLGGKSLRRVFVAGEECELGPGGVVSDSATVSVKGAAVHRGALLARRPVVLPAASQLAKGVAMLRSLYDVAPSAPRLADDNSFRSFVGGPLSEFAKGKPGGLLRFENYLGLMGRGGGFTPAGDDFVGGFLATYNYFARCRRSRTVTIPKGSLLSRTVPESGVIVEYSARGYVDEGLERLILNSSGRKSAGFFDELLAVASRGHTSGIDMSLGVLLCEAAVSDSDEGGAALKECQRTLWDS